MLTDADYKVLGANNKEVGVDIITLYYGNLWKFAMDRLNHAVDGYLITIIHMGNSYRVFRRMP